MKGNADSQNEVGKGCRNTHSGDAVIVLRNLGQKERVWTVNLEQYSKAGDRVAIDGARGKLGEIANERDTFLTALAEQRVTLSPYIEVDDKGNRSPEDVVLWEDELSKRIARIDGEDS